jgi:hypothetical protein
MAGDPAGSTKGGAKSRRPAYRRFSAAWGGTCTCVSGDPARTSAGKSEPFFRRCVGCANAISDKIRSKNDGTRTFALADRNSFADHSVDLAFRRTALIAGVKPQRKTPEHFGSGVFLVV